MLAYGGLVELAGLTQTDQATVLGLLREGAQRLQQDHTTRQRWQGAGEALLATRAEEGRLLQARNRGMAHVAGLGRNGAPGGPVPEEGERP